MTSEPVPCTPAALRGARRGEPLASRVFRVVAIEDAARGRWGEGRLLIGESEEEIRTREQIPGGVFIELRTEHHRARLHLEAKMQRRWRAEEDARDERMAARRAAFVRELTGDAQVSTVGGG